MKIEDYISRNSMAITKKTEYRIVGRAAALLLYMIAALLWVLLSSPSEFERIAARAEGLPALITSRTGLAKALGDAGQGDTVLVGDIDFRFPALGLHEAHRIIVDKSVTVRSGKPNHEPALFTMGSFDISGPVNGSQIVCLFENIKFEGLAYWGEDLTLFEGDRNDLDYVERNDKQYAIDWTNKQYAVDFNGNADVTFADCEFRGYANPTFYGGAFRGAYSEYYDNGNYGCELSVTLERCDFIGNCGLRAGGAIYLDGYADGSRKNISLTANDCRFIGNVSFTASGTGLGGGAIYARHAEVALNHCHITGNTANLIERPWDKGEEDGTKGGGIACRNSELDMTNCTVSGNTASMGGGVSLMLTDAVIDGCKIEGNRAETDAVIWGSQWVQAPETPDGGYFEKTAPLEGLSTNAGLGGGIHAALDSQTYSAAAIFINTSISQNTAQYGYGGLYIPGVHSIPPIGYGTATLVFCDYTSNSADYKGHNFSGAEWAAYPGDVWDISFVSAVGCVIADEDYPRHETPDAANRYNYFASEAPDNNRFLIPADVVKTLLNGSFCNSIGDFYVGRNYNPEVTLRLDPAGGTVAQSEIKCVYGQAARLPTPIKAGHDFDGWQTPDGSAFVADGLRFAAGIQTYEIRAAWTRVKTPFPAWGIVLIAAGGIAVLGAGAYFALLLRRRKAAPLAAVNIPNLSEPPAPDAKGFDALAAGCGLTAREKEIAALLIGGKSQTAIAEELFISLPTVKTHTQHIYDKFGVNSRFELIGKLGRVDTT
jgi:DNA-binding CsgD family transcriptional regulator